jgi:hypothetical protein
MKTYHPHQIYPFTVIDIREFNDRKFFMLSDGYRDTFRVAAYDYQLEWESSNVPKKINCYVTSVNADGWPFLAQVRQEVLAHNYGDIGTEYAFKLVAKKKDEKTGQPFFELHDVYGLYHRYYPGADEPEREIGDIFLLTFKGIEEKQHNRAYLRLGLQQEEVAVVRPEGEAPREESFLGSENELREFKSTIVYPAGEVKPNIDEQVGIICKTIAGFMNHRGGELYIGVNDSGGVVGIRYDYPYLNSSPSDPYRYKLNPDGYENKIRTSVKYLLGRTANSNIKVEFPELDGIICCKITINEVLKPIFFVGTMLFQRAGNMTQLLKGDEISWFVEDRLRKRNQAAGLINPPRQIENLEIQEEEQDIPSAEEVVVQKPVQPEDKVRYWMSFYTDGTWSFDTRPVDSADKVFEVAIPTSFIGKRLIMAYENGRINVVNPYDHIKPMGRNGRKLRTRGHRYSNGWNRDSGILAMFCAEPRDLLVIQSQKADGSQWVKIHAVDAIGVHGGLQLAGNVLVNPNLDARIVSVHKLPLESYHLISALVLKDHQTSGYLGYKRTDKKMAKVFMAMDQLLSPPQMAQP